MALQSGDAGAATPEARRAQARPVALPSRGFPFERSLSHDRAYGTVRPGTRAMVPSFSCSLSGKTATFTVISGLLTR